MVWSNWQGAIWRGALVVLLFWSGLAWTQPSTLRSAADPAERIMMVHENGKSTRCRVMETWRLDDGRVAHLLQALGSGELITIVDEAGPTPETMKNPRVMPKRIFPWGAGRSTPPKDAPVPPHLRIESGIVIKNETPPPLDAAPQGPVIVNGASNTRLIERPMVRKSDGPITIVQSEAPIRGPGLINRLIAKREAALQRPADPQVVEFRNTPPPTIINESVKGGLPPISIPAKMPAGSASQTPRIKTSPQPIDLFPASTLPTTSTPIVSSTTFPTTSTPIAPPSNGKDVTTVCDPAKGECKPAQATAKKSWRPGSNIQAWLQGSRATPSTPKFDTPKPKPIKTEITKRPEPIKIDLTKSEPIKTEIPAKPIGKSDAALAEEARKMQKLEEYLAAQNKLAEKKLAERSQGFSTARPLITFGPKPEPKKPEPSPLAIPGTTAKNDNPLVLPLPPKVDTTKPTAKNDNPRVLPLPPKTDTTRPTAKNDNPLVLPLPPKVDIVKPATSDAPTEKRDMWGNLVTKPVPLPGKSVLDPALLKPELAKLPPAPQPKSNDPLFAPEKLMASNEPFKPRNGGVAPPLTRPASETGIPHNPPDMRSLPGQPVTWPLGTHSVQAASSGLLGAPMYIPVPTVTVPQPHNPPVPPAPKMPDAPQLNAYVNAFSPPPAPKYAPQPAPMQGMMPPQGMTAQPMMTQQQMMMYQQMMAQYHMMAQQQMMMQYGYRPNPMAMYPYMSQQQQMAQATPSTGPMTNFSRQYMGPQPPNPLASNPSVQTGYAPASYPSAMPMHTMMPQQPTIQPVAHQQMPTQQQNITQQVEQLIKVMRESSYPAQREWAAQSLTSFEWRAHPQIVPALIQSASQDPAASVRAGCVNCLGRMNANVEPVVGVLHSMRNDIDPRVRTEVEQAFVRLGQTPMAQ